MLAGLTEEQQQLASTVRSLLTRRADSLAVRAAGESDAGFDRSLWETLCEQIGAAALAVPEEYDGAGFSLCETGIVLVELGRSLAPSPLLATLVASETVLASRDSAASKRLLPRIAAGEIATLAWSGTTGPAPLEPVRADGDTLTGTVANVIFGAQASILVVAAATADGVALFQVDPGRARIERTPAMDTTTQLATVTLDGVRGVPLDGDAAAALARAHLVGAAAVGSLQLGCAQRGLDMTVAHSRERVQFGRPIGSFQALKHRMADMLVEVEMSRSAVWAATGAVATDAPDAATLVAAAASYCGDALAHIASETVQMHGGVAITWEHDAQLVFKRAHALNQFFGLPHQHRAALLH